MIRRSNLLLAMLALLGLFAAQAVVAQTPPFTRTVIVNAGNNPIANGANLLAQLAGIPATAGPNQPWLLKVEPGIYDLNGNQLVPRNFIDIEGSGPDLTIITTNGAQLPQNAPTVRVDPGIESELRELSIRNTSNGRGVGIEISSSLFYLDRVNIDVDTGNVATGLLTLNSNPVIRDVAIRTSATRAFGIVIRGGGTILNDILVVLGGAGSINTGIQVDESKAAVIERALVFALGADTNIGVEITTGSAPQVLNTRVTTVGSTAIGISVAKEAQPTIKETTANASSNSLAVALDLTDALVSATESTFRARPLNIDHLGVFATRLSGESTLRSNQSNYDGSAFAVRNQGAQTAFFGASQLIGQATAVSLTGLKCVSAYDGNYDPLNAFCQ